jgi:hypothetical protein
MPIASSRLSERFIKENRGGGDPKRWRGAKCFPIGRAWRGIARGNLRKHTRNQIFFNGTSVALTPARKNLFFRIDIDGVLMDNPAPRLPGAACRIVYPR